MSAVDKMGPGLEVLAALRRLGEATKQMLIEATGREERTVRRWLAAATAAGFARDEGLRQSAAGPASRWWSWASDEQRAAQAATPVLQVRRAANGAWALDILRPVYLRDGAKLGLLED